MADILQNPAHGHLSGAIATAFTVMMNILLIHRNELGSNYEYPNDAAKYIRENSNVKFDFIIVGAGAAGCVLANRLSMNDKWKVLLIEAGGDPSTTTEVPAFYPTIRTSDEDWQFVTNKDAKLCQSMKGKVCRISKGKALGGTSTINNLLYMRGIPYDFEKWYGLGNENWNFESVSKVYEKLESYKEPFSSIKYGTNGDLFIENFNSKNEIKDLIYEAVKEYGVQNGTHLGYKNIPGTLYKGARFNMAKAFLTQIKDRPNFFLLKNCMAVKLFIPDIRQKRVKGLECIFDKKFKTLKAEKEVILSAGAVNTAKILLTSGIGPKNYLNTMRIPMVANLEVGKNLQDHVGVPIFVSLNSTDSKDQLKQIVDSTYNYVMYKTGGLSKININDLVGFINTGAQPTNLPNIAIYHYLFYPTDINLVNYLERMGYHDDVIKSLLQENVKKMIIMFTPTLLKPKSRGQVTLNGTYPLNVPIIKGNFLNDAEDLYHLLSAFKYIKRLIRTTPFLNHDAQLVELNIPSCRNLKFETDSFIKCQIRNLLTPQGDLVGTTKMGPSDDSASVVDENLLVKGVTRLRIVDSGFMPEIISGNIQGTMAMVAEKISQNIIEKYECGGGSCTSLNGNL